MATAMQRQAHVHCKVVVGCAAAMLVAMLVVVRV
jgi:hypothetical protein